MTKISITARIQPDGAAFTVFGRDAWALSELMRAGQSGCTPITHPGPRWSAYVHALRTERGLDIETVHEPHVGPFPGTHARYVLHSNVQILHRSDEQERQAA